MAAPPGDWQQCDVGEKPPSLVPTIAFLQFVLEI